ncbi:hypothetical protein CV770_14130 [Bradyrhizobium sp. AC87j1]|uniref:hypothetical protein n=1 Tax=Bradyrhizobium sp. AC87j1 TaxID=2055894 RepID=UPI000CEC4F5B|nr:hypothetical protein [Bradyrhizobium sp. AC87j1]PPQ18716.1 hypothetical protein CV770_14130 [Bradyrhizobium sp. AC87j1]
MRSVTLLALSLLLAGVFSHDSARGQSSAAPPVSLAPPNAQPPRANAGNATPKRGPALPPVTGGPPPAPNPAADYDGFSVGTADDNDTSSRAARPVRSRAAKGSKVDRDTNGPAEPSAIIDQEDEALKRKLMICQNCK